jgi:hypothetical protein
MQTMEHKVSDLHTFDLKFFDFMMDLLGLKPIQKWRSIWTFAGSTYEFFNFVMGLLKLNFILSERSSVKHYKDMNRAQRIFVAVKSHFAH